MEPVDNTYFNEARRKTRTDVRDIGEIPAVKNWGRRESCKGDLLLFMRTYFPAAFPVPFSPSHLKVISRLQRAILTGGRVLLPVPRGFGKSTLCVVSIIWGALYGHRKYFPLVTAGDGPALARMNTIKGLLEMTPPLFDDFPEVCHPIRKLEGIPQRAPGMLYKGETVKMKWKTLDIILPTIPELDPEHGQCTASGCVITACGITSKSGIRGLQYLLPDGSIVRPDFVLIDDPQDDESAKSPVQVKNRYDILTSSILGMTGHQKSMSVAIAANVIEESDLIEKLLDPNDPNGFEGERVSLIESFPDELNGLWQEYRSTLMTFDKALDGDRDRAIKDATAFYLANREALDRGCVVAWEDAFDETAVSGIQYAMNKYFMLPPKAFAAEMQNKPLVDETSAGQLTEEAIAAKILNGQPKSLVPRGMDRLTAFVDIQAKCLFWIVVAWGENFAGHVLDYGSFPDQKRPYFTLRDLPHPLSDMYPGRGQEAIWRAALDALTENLLSRQYERTDGATMRIEQLFPDANDGNAREVVFEFCRNSKHPTVVMPYISRGVKAGDKPFSEIPRKSGEKRGVNWRIPPVKGRNDLRYMVADVNWWKSFVRERWRTAVGDPGALTLFSAKPDAHRLFFEHMTSEYSIRTEGRGRKVDEWRMRPNMLENHWWDCLVGAAVAASYRGTSMDETGNGADNRPPPPIVSREELASMGWG